MSQIITIISCVIISIICTIGVFAHKYDDTLFQRIALGGCALSSFGVGYQVYQSHCVPLSMDIFCLTVAMWAISIFWKYK